MRSTAFLIAICFTTSIALADPPKDPEQPLPVGKWSVEFSNGVIEKVEIKKDGSASVTEPARTSDGKVTAVPGAFLFVCEDGRVERWTPVGKRIVVEHWASAEQMATGTSVKGIAEIDG
jgi:hypothetical protein